VACLGRALVRLVEHTNLVRLDMVGQLEGAILLLREIAELSEAAEEGNHPAVERREPARRAEEVLLQRRQTVVR
jgi:hypothetical protein